MKTGIELIAEKRATHEAKGWTKEHDKEHENGELVIVAADLSLQHADAFVTAPDDVPRWGLDDKSTIDKLSIAGSLIAAEIDRLPIYQSKSITKSYTLRTESGQWLGQIVLTSDGMFASVTDYGNLSYAWRAFGEDFRAFILQLNIEYFGSKLYTGMAYMVYGKKCEQACKRFAEHILPVLQKALREEIESEITELNK